jgi:hypothetical protein
MHEPAQMLISIEQNQRAVGAGCRSLSLPTPTGNPTTVGLRRLHSYHYRGMDDPYQGRRLGRATACLPGRSREPRFCNPCRRTARTKSGSRQPAPTKDKTCTFSDNPTALVPQRIPQSVPAKRRIFTCHQTLP